MTKYIKVQLAVFTSVSLLSFIISPVVAALLSPVLIANAGNSNPDPKYSITGTAATDGLTVSLMGEASANPFTGQYDDQHVSVDWDTNSNTLPIEELANYNDFNYLDTSNNGIFASSSWQGAHAYTASGTYNIEVRVHHANFNGNESARASISFTVVVLPQCSDSADNDSDGLIDSNDPGCESSADDDETNAAPPENTPPAIVLNGSNPMDITLGGTYTEPGAVANDAEDGLGLIVSNITGFVNNLAIGVYQIFYNFIDSGSLAAPEVIRTVNVNAGNTECSDGINNDSDLDTDFSADSGCNSFLDDSENISPSITLLGNEEINIIIGEIFSDPGATASDDEDGDLTDDIEITGSVDANTVNTYVLTYTVTDSNGATAEVTRTVNVNPEVTQCNDGIDNDSDGTIDFNGELPDTGCSSDADNTENVPPVIETELLSLTLTAGDPFSMPNYSASDEEDGDITEDVEIGGDAVDSNTPAGTYEITLDVVDSNGASATVTITVTIGEAEQQPPTPECSDNADNDNDGKTDENDPSCHTDGNPNNNGSYDPDLNDETNNHDMTPPVSAFNDTMDHRIIDTEMVALSLTGSSSDDMSGVATATMRIFKIGGTADFNESAFAEITCANNSQLIPIEIVQLNLQSVNPLNVTWSHNYNLSNGIFCAEVNATDNAGNVEHTATAGPIAYTYTAPTPSPSPTPPPPPSGGGGSPDSSVVGGGQGGSINPGVGSPQPLEGAVFGTSTVGQVLSESTVCSTEYLRDYIKLGKKNDPEQVTKLQQFLNSHMGANLPVTGFYGNLTAAAVNAFQVKYWQEVLLPWVPHGLQTSQTPTSYVYKTTKRWINLLACPDLNTPMPELP